MSRVNAKKYMDLLLCGLALILIACQKDHQRGPITYLLPWPDQQGEYHLREVVLHTIRYADELQGEAATIYVKAGLKDGKFQGEVARPRLIKKSARKYLAADYESAVAIAVYAHFERFLEWDRRLGIASDLVWPRQVGVEMNMRTETGDREHNNARYAGKYDITLVSPSMVDGLPLGLNGGILAHEHFHAHFQARVIRPLQNAWPGAARDKEGEETRDNNVYLVRAWNEGLADYWGYLYSQDPRFMTKTFVGNSNVRQLDEGASRLPDLVEFRERMAGKLRGECQKPSCQVYRVGTRVARTMKQLTDSARKAAGPTEPSALDDMAKRLISALPKLATRLAAEKTDVIFNPSWFFEEAFPRAQPLPAWACRPLEENLMKTEWSVFAERCGARRNQ